MSTTSGRVRPRRSAGPTVAVTGAAGGVYGVGRALAARLAGSGSARRVVAIDVARGDVAGTDVTWRIADVGDPLLASRLSGVDVLVHLAQDASLASDPQQRRAFNVRAAQTVLTASAASGVKRVVLLTSAMVYGARPDNPVPLAEGASLRADADTGMAGDFLEIEQLAARAPRVHPGLAVTVLRPAVVVGPGVDTVVTRHFESPRLLVVKGSVPCWQFCHVDDLVSALEFAALGRVQGAAAVGCDGWLEHEQVEALAEMRHLELPAGLTFGTAERLHRIGMTPTPAGELHYVVYPWVVDCAALREAGWRPAYDNEAALQALLAEAAGRHAVAGRRLDRKDVTVTAAGAAGATVAVIGTAALVRRARRRRKG
ncbi:MAG: NAD-dependent epimerase/dehydratase family protein [Streptosporangiales bacterium]|nr:NAD-dependent epimerase/dehydratase family protein [Streptosporangiales bacterium]